MEMEAAKLPIHEKELPRSFLYHPLNFLGVQKDTRNDCVVGGNPVLTRMFFLAVNSKKPIAVFLT